MRTLPAPTLTPQDLARFWSHVTKTESCWNWSGKARAVFHVDNHSYGASAISYMIHTGVYPDSFLCHTCDDPSCVNPDHLFEGTPKDNTQDMVQKGRHGGQRLNPVQVINMRDRFDAGTDSIRDLAREYNVSRRAVSLIVRRKNWTFVDE